MDDDEEPGPSSKLPKPLLCIYGAQANKLQCSIYQETCDKKHQKRKKIPEIKSKYKFKLNAILWHEYNQPYANVFSNVDCNSEETLYGCKSCKAMLSNEYLGKAQQKKKNDSSNNHESISNNVPETTDTSTEGRSQRAKRDAFRYLSSRQDPLYILCNVAKFDWKTRKKVPTMMIEMRKEDQVLHEAEERLIECAKIHDVNNTRHKEAATRILLLASGRHLFVADVCYHKNCYTAFAGGVWHMEKNVKQADNKSDLPVIEIEEFFDLVENHIICRGKVYTVSQLYHFYVDVFGKSKRSIDIKALLEDQFGDKLVYGKPVEFVNNESEFVYSSSTKFTPGIIRSATTSMVYKHRSLLEILQQEYGIISNFYLMFHGPQLQIK